MPNKVERVKMAVDGGDDDAYLEVYDDGAVMLCGTNQGGYDGTAVELGATLYWMNTHRPDLLKAVMDELKTEQVNKCATCKHWQKDEVANFRFCGIITDPILSDVNAKAVILNAYDDPGQLETQADFGCVLHEPRPTTTTD